MSEMIADLFEGQALPNQSSRTGVPQTVGSVMCALHVERLQSGGDHVVQADVSICGSMGSHPEGPSRNDGISLMLSRLRRFDSRHFRF